MMTPRLTTPGAMPATAAQPRTRADGKGGDGFDTLVAKAPPQAPKVPAEPQVDTETPTSALDRRLRLLDGSVGDRKSPDRDGHATTGRKARRDDEDDRPAEAAPSGSATVLPAPEAPKPPAALATAGGGSDADDGPRAATTAPDATEPQPDPDVAAPAHRKHRPAHPDTQGIETAKPTAAETPNADRPRDDNSRTGEPEHGATARKTGDGAADRAAEDNVGRPAPTGASPATGPNTAPAAAQAMGAASPGALAQTDAARLVAETVATSTQSVTHRDGVTTRTLEIGLNPDGSNPLTATLKLEGAQLTIEIAAPTPEAHRHLSGETDRIAASLRALGYDVQSVTVLQPAVASTPPAAAQSSTGGGSQPSAGQAFEDRGGSGGRHGSDTSRGDGRDGERREHARASGDPRGIYI